MSVFGRLDERILVVCLVSAPEGGAGRVVARAGLQNRFSAKRRDLDRSAARAIEQAVLNAVVHFGDKSIDSLGDEILARQQRIARKKRLTHWAAFSLLAEFLHNRLLEPTGLDHALSCLIGVNV